MAGGPLFPHSSYPVDAGSVFDYVYVSAGSFAKQEVGLGVAASLSGSATWRLRFQMPPTLPSGTAKLRLRAQANATSGSITVTPSWAMIAAGADPGGAALSAESGQTFTWAAGDNDKYKVIDVPLAATTVVADEIMDVDLVFSASTLAAVSSWQCCVIWV